MRKLILALIVLLLATLACELPTIPALDAAEIPGTDGTAALETKIAQNLEALMALSATPDIPPTEPPTETPIPLPTDTPQLLPGAPSDCIPNNELQAGRAVEVIDGDTIKVVLDQDGEIYTVRYIGMDAPENTDEIEYYGAEATAKNTELVNGKSVTLIKDVSKKDQDDRLLRYVLVGTVFVNYELIAQGYANSASLPPDEACLATFEIAEQNASAAKLGFWGVLRTVTAQPTGNASDPSDTEVCPCSGNEFDCADFDTHAAAQACYDYCVAQGHGDIHMLDSDDNTLVCEKMIEE